MNPNRTFQLQNIALILYSSKYRLRLISKIYLHYTIKMEQTRKNRKQKCLNKKGIDNNKENIKSGGTEGYMNRLIMKLCYSILFIAIGYLLGVSHMFLKFVATINLC